MKKALVVVSFGTSYHETRKKTIEACETNIRESLKDYDFYRAFTSEMIIQKLKYRDNIDIKNPQEIFNQLVENSYEEVLVQPLHIICGDEFNKLKSQFDIFCNEFKNSSLGNPLLTSIEDYEEVAQALKTQIPEMQKDEAVVFMGHGTTHHSNSAYSAIEYVLRDHGIQAFVGTVEGYPRLSNVIRRLKENNIKRVNLMPLMLVAGDHAQNDMDGEENSWKNILKNEGFEVEVQIVGLGENKKIQDIFKKHVLEVL